MNKAMSHVTSLLKQPSHSLTLNSVLASSLQQWRGIRVKVLNGNLDQAIQILQRKMQSSGIETIIKRYQPRHIKNSEKRVLARKSLERRIHAQNLSRKLRIILSQKISMERLIKHHVTHHIENSEKRLLARKALERKIQAQDLSRKPKSILTKKVRGL